MNKKKEKFTYKIILVTSLAIFTLVVNSPTIERNHGRSINKSRSIASIPKVQIKKKVRTSLLKNNKDQKAKGHAYFERRLRSLYPNSKIKVSKLDIIDYENKKLRKVLVEIETGKTFISYNALLNEKSGQVVNKWNQSYPETFGHSHRMNIDIREHVYKQ